MNIYRAITAVLLIGLIAGCSNEKKQKQQQLAEALAVDSSMSKTTAKKIFFNLPSPVEITQTLLKTEEDFDANLLNSPDNLDKYNTSSALALNFGVYGADLCYCRVYDQLQEAISYLSVIKKVTEKLQIPEEEGSETINRVEQSIENRDTIFYIISDTYAKADSYLKETERDLTASLILVGAWVEGMHYATKIAIRPDAKGDMVQSIIDQKHTVTNLINLMDEYKETPEIAVLIDDFNKLQEEYNQIEIVYDKSVVVTDQDKHSTTIDAPAKVKITAEQVRKIADLVDQIRNKII